MPRTRRPDQKPHKRRARFLSGCVLALLLIAGLGLALTRLSDRLPFDWRQLFPHRPRGIIIHHTATPDVAYGEKVDAAFIDREHAKRGFSIATREHTYHIGYHYLILRDGTVQPGRPEWMPGSHTLHHNDQLGICLVGNFSSGDNPHGENGSMRPSPQQLAALDKLLHQLIRTYHFRPNNLHRHRDYAQTACPGDRFPFEEVKRRAFAP